MKANKMKLFIVCLLLLLVNSLKAQAQQSPRWQVSLSGGWALPVGVYKKIAPEKGAVPVGGHQGFDKKGNSYAEPGYAAGIAVQYWLRSHWQVTANLGYSINTINSEVMSTYLEEFFNRDFDPGSPDGLYKSYRVDHEDYQVMYFLTGVAYTMNLGRWQFSANPQLGIATMSYPEYKIIFLWADDVIFQHRGETPSIQTLMWGSSVQLSYQLSKSFSAGLDVAYLSANFPYDISLIARGGALPLEKSDVVTYRQVQLGFQLGYRF
jgi:hypothetical protein